MRKPKYELGEQIIMPAQITRISTTSQDELEYGVELFDDVFDESEIDEYNVYRGESEVTDTDLISRQAAISIPILPKEARKKFKDYDDAFETGWLEALACVNMLPPIEPPKKVVAQIKVDTEEIVERIKEEYEIKDLPVCEDAISRADTLKALCAECDLNCLDGTDKESYCTEYAVVKGLPPVEPKQSELHIDEPRGYTLKTDKAEVYSKRPKGEWIFSPKDAIDLMFTRPKCNKCGFESNDGGNFCPNCGADMRGEE